MSQADLERVRNDLVTMQQAIGTGLPFDRRDVRLQWMTAALGAVVAAWPLVLPWDYRLWVLVPVGLFVAVYMAMTWRCRRQRSRQPLRWREYRLSGIAVLIVTPLAVGYMVWERAFQPSSGMAGAAAFFFIGLALLWIAFVDRTRRFYAGGALPMMIAGLALPLCTGQQALIVVGLCVLVAGLASAAIQIWQLRNAEGVNVSH